VDGDPYTGENGEDAAPDDVPYRTAVVDVITVGYDNRCESGRVGGNVGRGRCDHGNEHVDEEVKPRAGVWSLQKHVVFDVWRVTRLSSNPARNIRTSGAYGYLRDADTATATTVVCCVLARSSSDERSFVIFEGGNEIRRKTAASLAHQKIAVA